MVTNDSDILYKVLNFLKKPCQKHYTAFSQKAVKQSTARMFNGKSKRGGGGFCSAASIENWVETFKYVIEYPEEEDHDPYQAREISPNEEWYKFVELIHTPIDPLIISSWKKMSKKKLGDEAKKYGFTVGVANSKSIANIHERMFEMVERRRDHFWTKLGLDESDSKQGDPDYKLMNIFQLKEIAKERGISTNLDKDTLISEIIVDREDNDAVFEYIDMSLNKLKLLAKDRGLLEYNCCDSSLCFLQFVQNSSNDILYLLFEKLDTVRVCILAYVASKLYLICIVKLFGCCKNCKKR